MTSLRILPGAVTADSARLLVLARGRPRPRIALRDEVTGAVREIALDPPAPSPAMAAALARRQVALFTARLEHLAPDRPYVLEEIGVPSGHRVPLRTLGQALPDTGLCVLVASCYYDYFHHQEHYRNALRSKWFPPPAFKLLVGDNLYLDVAPDQRSVPADGHEETVHRYVRYFLDSRYGEILEACPTLTTWDDHEFWNNYPETQCHLSRTAPSHIEDYGRAGKEALVLFQASLNHGPDPLPGGAQLQSASLSYSFVLGEAPHQLSFFVADLRTSRTLYSGGRGRMLAPGDLERLEAWARGLQVQGCPGVLVLGQPLWAEPGSCLDYTPANYEQEYARIWAALRDASRDILMVSGDVHHSRLLTIELGGGRSVHELVTSPACHIPSVASMALNYKCQGRGKVEIPLQVPVHALHAGGAMKPVLRRYHFGTDVPNTVAALVFHKSPGGGVDLSCTFFDLMRHAPAPAVELVTPNGRGRWRPEHPHCRQEKVLHLR